MSAFSDFGVPGLILCRPIDAYLLREICPKECNLKAIGVVDQYACNIISSNIDSYLKEKLNGKSSFQLLEFLSPDTAKKFYEFGLQNISNPDEVILKPYVLKIR